MEEARDSSIGWVVYFLGTVAGYVVTIESKFF
jgi:hypothetical protein